MYIVLKVDDLLPDYMTEQALLEMEGFSAGYGTLLAGVDQITVKLEGIVAGPLDDIAAHIRPPRENRP